jgi:hypothetical protein
MPLTKRRDSGIFALQRNRDANKAYTVSMANNTEMTQEQMIAVIRRYIDKEFGTQRAAADYWDMSESYLSEILSGKKLPTQKILDDIGVEHLDKYRWKRK